MENKRKIISQILILCCFMLLLILAIHHIEQKEQMKLYTFTYHPVSDEDKEAADQDYEIINERVGLLDGNISCRQNDDGGFTVTTDTDFGGIQDIVQFKALLFTKNVNAVIWDSNYNYLAQEDDFKEISLSEDGDYLQIKVSEDAGKNIAESFVNDPYVELLLLYSSLNNNMLYGNEWIIEKTDDDTVWKCAIESGEDIRLLLNIRDAESLSHKLPTDISSYVSWIDPDTDSICGQNQIALSSDPKDFPDDYVRIYYNSTRMRYTKDERESLLVSAEEKLDTIGVPYAIGYDFNGIFVIAVPDDDAITQASELFCDNLGIYLQTGADPIYLLMYNLMIDEDGIAVVLSNDDAEILEQDMEANPDQRLYLSIDSSGENVIAYADMSFDEAGSVITFNEYPDDRQWIHDMMSVCIQTYDADSRWGLSPIE